METLRHNPEETYHALDYRREQDPLAAFTPEQQAIIREKHHVLSSLAYFIGKDFSIPVELNTPGAGWLWNFKENIIKIDPKDLLEKPIEELRYLICHEGGHRRVSRTDFIPLEEWQQSGFPAMMNFIEDPRNDNFVAESYPAYRKNIEVAWGNSFKKEQEKMEEMAVNKLGFQPRFMQAGFEYIKQWFKEVQGQPFEVSEQLPVDVKSVVKATLASAHDSWWTYPSRQEADHGGKIDTNTVDGETIIREYAKTSYTINRDKIWPEFKKLIEEDMKDERLQEFMKDMSAFAPQGGATADKQQGIPQDLKDELTPEEQKALESASAKASVDKEAIDLNSLSEELKQKIKDYVASLPEEQQREIEKRAQEAFKEFEDALNEELEGKLTENPEEAAARLQEEEKAKQNQQMQSGGEPVRIGELRKEPLDLQGLKAYKERLTREINKDQNVYEQYRREVLPLIEKLEQELQQIFVDTTTTSWRSGYKTGKRIDIKKRIQEKAKDVPAIESRAWQKRERPQEKDYAITLLNDLSGSMRGATMQEDFKAKIVFAEVLNKIGINVEILGFNDEVYEYQAFGQPMSPAIREHMGGMFKEVDDSCCKACGGEHNETDLGWATQVASERLSQQKAVHKILIALSDGRLEESSKHPRSQYGLGKITQQIADDGKSKAILLKIAGMKAEEIVTTLAGHLKDAIVNTEDIGIISTI